MKKFILFLFFMPLVMVGNAQVLTESDLAKIDIKAYDNGKNYSKAASVIAKDYPPDKDGNLTYIIHSGFISGYQNRYGDNLKPPTNVYHRMTA